MKIEVIPAILAKRKDAFRRKLTLMEGHAPLVQIDVMDGQYVSNETWYEARDVAMWNMDLTYELDLMVNDPVPIIEAWRRVRGLRRAIVHAGSPITIGRTLEWIRRHKLEAGIGIAPDDSIDVLTPHMKHIDVLLVMGGTPGWSGQTLNPKTIKTVEVLRKRYPKLPIGFDIGVNEETVPTLVRAGVTRLCSGSAIFKSRSPVAALQRLKKIAHHSI